MFEKLYSTSSKKRAPSTIVTKKIMLRKKWDKRSIIRLYFIAYVRISKKRLRSCQRFSDTRFGALESLSREDEIRLENTFFAKPYLTFYPFCSHK